MTGPQTTQSRARGLLTPIIGGVILIGALVAAVYFRGDLWQGVKSLGRSSVSWVTDWVPAHPGQASAMGGFALVALGINWVAHIRGRLRAWLFALVVEMGLWLLFWNGLVIPSFNELLGLDIAELTFGQIMTSGLIVMGLTGVVFWFLEAREEWRKSRAAAGS